MFKLFFYIWRMIGIVDIAIMAAQVIVAGSATSEMTSPEFWGGTEEIVMTPSEIERYNAALIAEGNLDLVDIFAADSVVSGDAVRAAIESYRIPAGYDYFDTRRVTAAEKAEILASRNLAAVPPAVRVRYGVTVEAADLRSFPTAVTCTDDGIVKGSLCFDDFQQSTLWMGEGVLIWHESADGEWFFVRAENYAGWVRASQIGLCSFEEMSSYVRSREFAVVLEQKRVDVAGRPMRLMMGTRLKKACGQVAPDTRAVLVPVRREDGSLGTVETVLDVEMSDRYLPYTTAGVLRQAFKLLGTPYSWGNAGGYNDCSGTLLSVYYCFGVHLPRNSSSMRKMVRGNLGKPCVGSGGAADFRNVQPGSPVILPGHAMMFLGVVDGEAYILHAVNAIFYKTPLAGAASGTMRREQCSITLVSSTSDICRKTGISFLDAFVNVIEIR